MTLLTFVAIMLFGFAAYNLTCAFVDVPTGKTSKMMLMARKQQGVKTEKLLDVYITKIAALIAPYIRLDKLKRNRLLQALDIAGIDLSPEVYTARAWVSAGLVGLCTLPMYFKMITFDMRQIEQNQLKKEAAKRPKKIQRYSMPVSSTRLLLQKDRRSASEEQIMLLSKQALLSTAELIKCVDQGVRDLSKEEKILDALYNDDDTTSDNIGSLMQVSRSKEPVTLAVANLYLRKQIIFERI